MFDALEMWCSSRDDSSPQTCIESDELISRSYGAAASEAIVRDASLFRVAVPH